MEFDESIYFRAAAAALSLFGFKVEYFEHVNIIKLSPCDQKNNTYYIDNVPKITNYKNLIKIDNRNYGHLKLCFADGKTLIINLKNTHILINKRHNYHKTTLISGCKGVVCHLSLVLGIILDNGDYINFTSNGWVNSNYRDILSGKTDLMERDDPIILDPEFKPVEPIKVDIFNEGSKLVINCPYQHYLSDVFNFTIFTYNNEYLVVDDIYKSSYRIDLFDYVAENGELFTMLLDCKTNTINLVSNTKTIQTKKLTDCKVKRIDGKYNGHISDIQADYLYCYNYEWFTFNHYSGSILKAKVKMVNSGSRTKQAIKID